LYCAHPCGPPFEGVFGIFSKFFGTNHNSFSWPAKQVSDMDVAHKNIPDVKVTAMKASSIPSTLRFVMKLASDF